MDKHLTILAVLYIGLGALGVFVVLIVFLGVAGGGLLSGDARTAAMTTGIGSVVTFLILLLCAPAIIGGFGLLRRRSWSRILLLILGAINLLNIPLGTILGIYTIWVMMQDDTKRLLGDSTLIV